MPEKNALMLEIQCMLGDHVSDLMKSVGKAKSLEEAAGIAAEVHKLTECHDRLVQLLFSQQSDMIEAAIGPIRKANEGLEKAIASMKSLTTIVDTGTAFLSLVDELLGLLKPV